MNYSGSSNHPITVEILTASYRILGKVLVTRTGLIGVMTDTNSSIVDIHEAQMARLHIPNKLTNRFQAAQVVKSQVVAVSVQRRDDLGPLVTGAYNNPVNQFTVHLITSDYEMDGVIEWNGRFDMAALMGQGYRDFIPLYHAVISAVLNPAVKIESPAVLVNRRFIDLVALTVEHKLEQI